MTETFKTILITGAAGGLGSALALACARKYARVILLDRKVKDLESLCDDIESSGALAPGYCQMDLLQAGPEQFSELVDGLVAEYGALDGLAHCAASFNGLQPLEQIAGDAWLGQIQVNLNAAWALTTTCLPHLRLSRGKVIFTLDSNASSGNAYWGAYGVSKGALNSMVGILAGELEGSGIGIHGVEPGPMRTDLRATAYHAENPQLIPSPSVVAEKIATLLMGNGQDSGVFLDFS